MRAESDSAPEGRAGGDPPPGQPHLQVKGITKRFGGVEALRGVDFETRRGEVMALVGDNGAGKSTLMKILAGADVSDAGAISLDGREVAVNSPLDASALGIRIVFQDLALCENLDVSANLFLGNEPVVSGWARMLPRPLRPLDEFEMERQALKAIDRLQVRTLSSVRSNVSVLSGGQRQAIAIARAVREDSTLVLLDEPTAALGVAQTRQVLDVVKRLRDTGQAVVYVSHNLGDVFEVSDRITVLRHGRNVAVLEREKTDPDEVVVWITGGQRDKSVAN